MDRWLAKLGLVRGRASALRVLGGGVGEADQMGGAKPGEHAPLNPDNRHDCTGYLIVRAKQHD